MPRQRTLPKTQQQRLHAQDRVHCCPFQFPLEEEGQARSGIQRIRRKYQTQFWRRHRGGPLQKAPNLDTCQCDPKRGQCQKRSSQLHQFGPRWCWHLHEGFGSFMHGRHSSGQDRGRHQWGVRVRTGQWICCFLSSRRRHPRLRLLA